MIVVTYCGQLLPVISLSAIILVTTTWQWLFEAVVTKLTQYVYGNKILVLVSSESNWTSHSRDITLYSENLLTH